MVVNALVEGVIDEAVAHRLIAATGHTSGICYGKRGIGYIKQKIAGFNGAAMGQPILALIDFMDTDAACPPAVVAAWLPHRNDNMLCRVVVREIESWLLADPSTLSTFLRVSPSRMPHDPESISDPKRTLVNLARHSQSRGIRDALVPRNHTGAVVGALYNSAISDYTRSFWNIDSARAASISLDRCVARLEQLTSG